jgi:short-subunit dehydrogenase
MTRAFLPSLKRSGEAQVVNISSLFGLIAPPGQTAYSASKFAVRGFSEALRRELEDTGVGVTTVHPGGVATAIARNARMAKAQSADEAAAMQKRFERLLRMPPELAGETIVKGIERRSPRVIVGNDAKVVSLIERLMPVSYWDLVRRI